MLLVLQHYLEKAYRFPGGSCPTRANIRSQMSYGGKCPGGRCPTGANIQGANVQGADVLWGRMSRGRCRGTNVLIPSVRQSRRQFVRHGDIQPVRRLVSKTVSKTLRHSICLYL